MIHTERLTLVPLQIEHAETLLDLWSDPQVIRFTNMKCIETLNECRKKVSSRIKTPVQFYAVLKDGTVAGMAACPIIKDEDTFECGFAYQIIRKYWGNGIGYEAAKGLFDYIANEHKNAVVYADVVADNTASVRILDKLGFERYGNETEGFCRDGIKYDVINYKRIFKNEVY